MTTTKIIKRRRTEQEKLELAIKIEPLIYQMNPVVSTLGMGRILGESDKYLESLLYESKLPIFERLRVMYRTRGSVGPIYESIIKLHSLGQDPDAIRETLGFEEKRVFTLLVKNNPELCELFGVEYTGGRKKRDPYTINNHSNLSSDQFLSNEKLIKNLVKDLKIVPCLSKQEIWSSHGITGDVFSSIISRNADVSEAYDIYEYNRKNSLKTKNKTSFTKRVKRTKYKINLTEEQIISLYNSLIADPRNKMHIIINRANLTQAQFNYLRTINTLIEEGYQIWFNNYKRNSLEKLNNPNPKLKRKYTKKKDVISEKTDVVVKEHKVKHKVAKRNLEELKYLEMQKQTALQEDIKSLLLKSLNNEVVIDVKKVQEIQSPIIPVEETLKEVTLGNVIANIFSSLSFIVENKHLLKIKIKYNPQFLVDVSYRYLRGAQLTEKQVDGLFNLNDYLLDVIDEMA